MGILWTADHMFDGVRFIENAALLVEANAITYAGAASGLQDAAGHDRQDFGDATICPGFMDLHVHFTGTAAYSMGAFALEDERSGALRCVPRARALLHAGFTSVRDCGSGPGPFLRDAIGERSFEGPRIHAARAVLSQTGGHCDVTSMPVEWLSCRTMFRLADGVDDARKAVREQVRGGADFIKLCTTGGVLSERGGSHHEQFTDPEVAAVVDEAHRLGLRVAAHAQGTGGVMRALRNGVDTIEHGFYLDEGAIDLFLERDATLVPTLSIMHQICTRAADLKVPAASIAKAQRARDRHIESVGEALKAGVRIATGTDFVGAPGTEFEECALEMELLVAAGATTEQALGAATSKAARALSRRGLPIHERIDPGWPERVGSLTPGFLADAVVVRGDPRTRIRAVRDVGAVMKDGVRVR